MNYGDLHSPAADRNKEPILSELKDWIKTGQHVLEIGSASGQHAIFFKEHLDCQWQASDQMHYIERMPEAILQILSPIEIEIGKTDFAQVPGTPYDVVYTANTLHIMSWKCVQIFLKDLPKLLGKQATFIFYGPLHFDGDYQAQSNMDFDAHLKERDASMGIRDYFQIKKLLSHSGFEEKKLVSMPANNHLAIFKRL